jgi:RNA polymerase sigma-70 factor (ECF subfamily)
MVALAVIPRVGPLPTAQLSERERDAALVEAMAAGERRALDELYGRYAARVMALLVRMLPSRAEAEERLQDVFLELWRRAPQYDRSRAAVSTWVITVARSRALDTLRSRARRRADAQVPSEDAQLAAPESDRPDRRAEEAMRRQRLARALEALSPEQRQVLDLSYFAGRSHSEIAAELALPLGTVKSRIIGGMKVLRQVLGGGS